MAEVTEGHAGRECLDMWLLGETGQTRASAEWKAKDLKWLG